ncbi:MAG: nucleotidyltransferase family protein [Oscillospiraceae bacterium]|nr:nucleotidyltransferase family protein [Oscillospiraceae bacterium]
MKIGCVIMASGMARRFGSNKLLHDFHGEPIMVRILRSMKAAPVDLPVVVTRHPEVVEICNNESIHAILHDLPKRSDTVRLGMEYLLEKDAELDGIMFAASDQPCLKAESITALCDTFAENPNLIYRLSYQGIEGNPVLFPKAVFEELLHLPEGKGGGVVIKRHPELLRLVEASDERELIDVDTPEILASLL